MNAQLKYWYWLGALTGIGPKRARMLLDIYGNAYEIYRRTPEELSALEFLTNGMVGLITDPSIRTGIEEKLAAFSERGIDVISVEDARYPELILEIDDPPPVLFMRGAFSAKSGDRRVGIVGTRRPSAYGISMTKKIVSGLAGYGYTIVSGLAAGIDSIAHRAAVESGAKTIAVLGCGVERAYPAGNRRLMEEVLRTGSVYSEYPPGTLPYQQNFPRRNRLISGMSAGVVVVEAGERSGSLITAGFAGEQGRDVFAVPGNATSPMSKGTNALLRDGAFVVTSAEDIVFSLNRYIDPAGADDGEYIKQKKVEFERRLETLSGPELDIVRALSENGPYNVDEIAGYCGIPAGVAGSLIIMMELKGALRRLSDGTYELMTT